MSEQEAGRELDARVAEVVMGEARPTANVPDGVLQGITEVLSDGENWIGTTNGYDSGDVPGWRPRHFSTDIAAAMEVWASAPELRNASLHRCDTGKNGPWSHRVWWEVRLHGPSVVEGWRLRRPPNCTKAPTAPLAICLAALDAAQNSTPTDSTEPSDA